MRFIFTYLLLFFFSLISRAQTKDSCLVQQKVNDSLFRTYFCSKYPFEGHELQALRFFCGFKSTSVFRLTDVEKSIIDTIEKRLLGYLKTINYSGRMNIVANLHLYHRQYFCFLDSKGGKVVMINFVYYNEIDNPEELTHPAFYTDGGSRFWKVKYKVKTKTFFDFQVNGTA